MPGSLAKICRNLILTFAIILFIHNVVPAQQIQIPRIGEMPDFPQPYLMRDWKQVARGYDSLVFDFDRSGQYLPLIQWRTQRVNYPDHPSFILHTVVGTKYPHSGEAINILPAVIGASLAGIDKSQQNGQNWVLYSEEFFNRRPAENVYLNHPATSSGSDWWYDTMPNVFFYQLYHLYPGTGDFDNQFTTVADRWLEAVAAMGGSTTPWKKPQMNYRGWYLESMTPNTNWPPEPEAAGAIGWLLYHAYIQTGLEKYRIGAEWCMEFLHGLSSNPAYELQLPYGAYIAARMNAELGTNYNLSRLVNWCFTPAGNVRSWGAIVGSWGGYDVSGLIGEVNGSNDYAFLMNTFEQAGALLPMVRYDDRFAHAIGRWILNAANAARLFYPGFLPDANQDSEEWSHQYDPNSYIAHEAMRQFHLQNPAISPFATGDAVSGNWGETNLALYGSSHVGIFAAIIDTTQIPGILKLNTLATDYFRGPAYPTFLYYNPFDEEKLVTIDPGTGSFDLYDAVSNQFLLTIVSGQQQIPLPAKAAVLLVICPAGGEISEDLDKLLVNGVVIDYQSGQPVANYPPRIKSLAAEQSPALTRQSVKLFCSAEDRDGDVLSFDWSVSGGTISGEGFQVTWAAPDSEGIFTIQSVVNDGNDGNDTAAVEIETVVSINYPPEILSLFANPRKMNIGGTTQLLCRASDPNGDQLAFTWSAQAGTFSEGDSLVNWTAPAAAGNYFLSVQVSDGLGGLAADSIEVMVRDFSQQDTGRLVVFYPLDGNADDAGSLGLHGQVSGATPISDRFGTANQAYAFDGVNDYIRVPNHDSLNFQKEISVSLWLKPGAFFDREAYPVSHGNWENRWKISITNQRIRWTIKTDSGIKDLDSETQLELEKWYHVVGTFNGTDMELYVNGNLDAFTSWSGSIEKTTYDLAIAQHLPGVNGFNYNGALDEIRLYNYALPVAEIQNLFSGITGITHSMGKVIPADYRLYPNFPNPFNSATTIRYEIQITGRVQIDIFNILGEKIKTLVDGIKPAGLHTVSWLGLNDAGSAAPSGIYIYRMKINEVAENRKMLLLR